MTNRRAFESLTEEHNQIALVAGRYIYLKTKERFPGEDDADRDLILNSLCVAMVCFLKQHVDKDNYSVILQVIHKILTQNLKDSTSE